MFSFYTVDTEYCSFLRKFDSRVPYTMDKKSSRPFVGIVFSINGFQYYAPLTSPKPKHLAMKNQADFHKINGGKWGAINFNNMIPVPSYCLKKLEMNITPNDTKDDINYKYLLRNQLSWCNANAEIISRKAEKLYNLIGKETNGTPLINRCCEFPLLEKKCQNYIAAQPAD